MLVVFFAFVQVTWFYTQYWLYSGNTAAAIGIIGGADGPTSIFIAPDATNDSMFVVMGSLWGMTAGVLAVIAVAVAIVIVLLVKKKRKHGTQ